MNRKKRIEKKIKEHIKEFNIQIEDKSMMHKGHNNFDGKNETHFLIKLFKIENNKYDRLKTHRKINELLKEEFLEGLHSIEIKIID